LALHIKSTTLSLDLPAECGFYEDIKMEWAEHGNKIEEFEIKGPKIVIILDNASIHKKKEFLEK